MYIWCFLPARYVEIDIFFKPAEAQGPQGPQQPSLSMKTCYKHRHAASASGNDMLRKGQNLCNQYVLLKAWPIGSQNSRNQFVPHWQLSSHHCGQFVVPFYSFFLLLQKLQWLCHGLPFRDCCTGAEKPCSERLGTSNAGSPLLKHRLTVSLLERLST